MPDAALAVELLHPAADPAGETSAEVGERIDSDHLWYKANEVVDKRRVF